MRETVARLASTVGLILLTTVAGHGKQADGKQADAESEVTVCLHNSIVAAPGAVERAKLVARNMFASIGIHIAWRNCGSEPHEGLCIDVLLAAGDYNDESNGPLAEAYPFAGATGHITVRYDRVHNSVGVSRDLEPVLLGHVLVHEITHVLQCLDRHADTGIMKAHYSSEDYYDMRWKPLTFTPEDIDLLHLGMRVLRARNHVESPELEHSHSEHAR